MLLFIFLYRTTFGVDKPVFVSEKQRQKKKRQNKTNLQQKGMSIQLQSYSKSKIVHLNKSAVMARTKIVFGLHKVTWRIPCVLVSICKFL